MKNIFLLLSNIIHTIKINPKILKTTKLYYHLISILQDQTYYLYEQSDKLYLPYQRALQKIDSHTYPRIQNTLNQHWFRVKSRLTKLERAQINKSNLEVEEDEKRLHLEYLIHGKQAKSLETKTMQIKTRLQKIKEKQARHLELRKKRVEYLAQLEYEQRIAENMKERQRKEEEEEKQRNNWSLGNKNPDLVQQSQNQSKELSSPKRSEKVKRPLPTYEDAKSKRLQNEEQEIQRGKLYSQQISKRQQKAQQNHVKKMEEIKNKFMNMDQKIQENMSKSIYMYEKEQDMVVQNYAKKQEKFYGRKDQQFRKEIKEKKEKNKRQSEKSKLIQENLQKLQEEQFRKTNDLSLKLSQPRVRSISYQGTSLVPYDQSRIQYLQQENQRQQDIKYAKIMRKHMAQSESNKIYKDVITKIQTQGNFYNYQIETKIKKVAVD